MTWQISHNKKLNCNIAVKMIDGYITLNGKRIFVKSGSVMVDDENKSLFTPLEWDRFKACDYDLQLYKIKKIFNGNIVDLKII